MSVQAARAFWKKANTDLMARVIRAIGAEDPETGQQLARAAGFVFTPEEFKQTAVEAANKLIVPGGLTAGGGAAGGGAAGGGAAGGGAAGGGTQGVYDYFRPII